MRLQNSNGSVVLEKNGKYVKGKYSLTGGSVGLFEGKKIGRAKNLEKLQEEIASQESVVGKLKNTIQEKHNEVIAFNEELKEQALREAQEDISHLTNHVFSLQNKMENLHGSQAVADSRMQETQLILEETIAGIESTRAEWMHFVSLLNELREKLHIAEACLSGLQKKIITRQVRAYNEFNLQVTRQQSKINALKQELDFKKNQLNDLSEQIDIKCFPVKANN